MTSAIGRIKELEAQRAQLNADIDREIEGLRGQATAEMEELRAELASIQDVLNPVSVAALRPLQATGKLKPQQPTDPWAETDAKHAGGGGREDGVSREDFVDELAALREAGAAKHARRA